MNKKIIMLISALICANNMVFTAQKRAMQVPSAVKVASVAEPLTAEEDKVYQELIKVSKNNWNWDLIDKSTLTFGGIRGAIVILDKRADYLKQEIRKPSKLWPYWLAASFGSAVDISNWSLNLLPENIAHVMYRYSPARFVYGSAYDINEALMLPHGTISTLIFSVAPLMAVYGLYRKYTTKEQQLQELRDIHEMRQGFEEILKSTY